MVKEYCSIIYKELKKYCKGKITVQPLTKNSSSVIVMITQGDNIFTLCLDDVVSKMYIGIDTKKLVNDIVEKYKYSLLFNYFYQ